MNEIEKRSVKAAKEISKKIAQDPSEWVNRYGFNITGKGYVVFNDSGLDEVDYILDKNKLSERKLGSFEKWEKGQDIVYIEITKQLKLLVGNLDSFIRKHKEMHFC